MRLKEGVCMYHNAPPISANDIDWNTVFFNQCVQARADLLIEANTTPLPTRLAEKIEKAIENNGLTINQSQFLSRIYTDEVYQSLVMKSPSRSSFHENSQISKIDSIASLTATKPQGLAQRLIIPSNPSDKNWIDCIVTFTDSSGIRRRAFGSMKFARTQGTHQSRQITDQTNYLIRCQEYISLGLAQPSDLFFGAGDGDYFHPNQDDKNSQVSAAIHANYASRVYNGTTGQVIDWLLSF